MEKVDGKNFEQAVLQSGKPVLVYFCAPWCRPCTILRPIMEEISLDFKEQLGVMEADVDASPELASSQGVISVPTIVLYINGQANILTVGFDSKEDIVKQITKKLESK
ncbi:MAG: thioredoxin domain-containing protein [bacterium]